MYEMDINGYKAYVYSSGKVVLFIECEPYRFRSISEAEEFAENYFWSYDQ